MLYETGAWLDKYVKTAEPRKKPEKKPEKPEKPEKPATSASPRRRTAGASAAKNAAAKKKV